MKVFYFEPRRPLSKVREVEVKILTCRKTVWALLPNGQRRLLGSSIFFTTGAAERAKRGALTKYTNNTYLQRINPDAHRAAVVQLDTLNGRTLH